MTKKKTKKRTKKKDSMGDFNTNIMGLTKTMIGVGVGMAALEMLKGMRK